MALTFILLKRVISDVFIPCWNSTVLFGLNWTETPARGALSNKRSTWRGKAWPFLSILFWIANWINICHVSSIETLEKIWKLQKHTNTVHKTDCSFQLKWTLVAVKHQQLLFLLTHIIITGADYSLITFYFCTVPCTILWWPQCMTYHSAWFVN